MEHLQFSGVTQGREERRKTNSFGVDVEMMLIVVYVPEGRVASVRDVACSRDVQWRAIQWTQT